MDPALTALRQTPTRAFEREGPGGGTYRQHICPACREDRRGEHFVDGVCDRCFRQGKDLPEKEEITMEPQATPLEKAKRERTFKVNQRRNPCPNCGKMLPPGPLALHVRRCGGTAPGSRGGWKISKS